MTCDTRHVECPDCGQNVWQFRSKRLEKEGKDPYYFCDTDQHRNYHVCEDEPEEEGIPLPTPERPVTVLKVKPKESEPQKVMKEVLDKMEPYKDPVELAEEFKTAEDELKFQRSFRYLEITASKAKRVSEELIPELGQYGKYEYFQSAKVTIDNPDMDLADLVRRLYLEIDTRIDEQIAQDRAKLIQALEEGIK